jgi:hypothetical protein
MLDEHIYTISRSSGCHTVTCIALVCVYQQETCYFILECLIEKSNHIFYFDHAYSTRGTISALPCLCHCCESLQTLYQISPVSTSKIAAWKWCIRLFRNWDQGSNWHYRCVYAPMHQGLEFCFETKFLYFVIGGFSLGGWSLCEEYKAQSSEGTGNANLYLEVKLLWDQLRW